MKKGKIIEKKEVFEVKKTLTDIRKLFSIHWKKRK